MSPRRVARERTPPEIARYHRRVAASLARVWENVRDWEHLPWLHAGSFRSIALEEAGAFGWRARIGLHGAGAPEIRLELVVEGDRYVSRTLEGPGAGTEIWTALSPAGDATDVTVRFCVPGVPAGDAARLGAAYVRLYARLWDEDEGMMIERTRRLAARAAVAPPAAALDLGDVETLAARLPLTVELAGRRLRVVCVDGTLHAHAAECPHRLGPLDGPVGADGGVRCPWHGYRFDVRSGRCIDGPPTLRLARSEVVVEAGRARLLVRAGACRAAAAGSRAI